MIMSLNDLIDNNSPLKIKKKKDLLSRESFTILSNIIYSIFKINKYRIFSDGSCKVDNFNY